MPVPSQGYYVFTVFRLLTDFVCLYTLLLPLISTKYGAKSNAACSYHMLVLNILMNGLSFVKIVQELEIFFFNKMTSHFSPIPEKKKKNISIYM